MTLDIRDTAFEVNDRLKKLILPEDDADIATDEEDKLSDMIAAFHIPKPVRSASSGHTSPHHQAPPTSTTSTDTKTGQGGGGGGGGGKGPKDGPQSSSTSQPPSSTAASTAVVGVANGGMEEGLSLVDEQPKLHLLSVLAVLIPHMKFTHQETRKETLRWLMWLHQQLPRRVSGPASLLASSKITMMMQGFI